MKSGLHTLYGAARITCACGERRETRSTIAEMRVEACSSCHPAFTGERRVVDSAGRIERFRRRYALAE